MRVRLRAILLLAVLIMARPGLAGSGGPGGPGDPAPRADAPKFETFRILLERNIFDPERRGAGDDRPRPASSAPAKNPAGDRIGLEGVLIEKGRTVAFFEGVTSESRTVIQLGHQIAGHRLVEAATGGIRLEKNGKTKALPIGGQLSRKEKGDWEIAKDVIPLFSNSSDSSPTQSETDESSSDNGSDDSAGKPPAGKIATGKEAETLRTFKERRRKEGL